MTTDTSATTDTRTRRRFLKATGAVAGGAALAGCTGGSGGQGDNGSGGNATAANGSGSQNASGDGGGGGRTGNNQLDLINSTVSSFDPIAASDTASGEVTTQLFDGLMTYPNGEVPVTKLIASGYEVSEDYTTYTFNLKEGVQFHNGDEVTASDFVYSYERLAGSPNSQAVADILNSVAIVHETNSDGSYKPNTLATEAVDKYTFRFDIEQPFHAALQVLSNNQFAAVPEGIVGDIQGYQGEMKQGQFANNPIGAGPFQFGSYQSGNSVSVERFGDYHAKVPQVAGVRWQIIEDTSAIYNYVMERNADVFNVPTAQYNQDKVTIERTDDTGRRFGTYGQLRNGATVNYLEVPSLSVYYIGFNTPNVPTPVRKAAAYALNQGTIVDQVFKGRGLPAYHYTLPSIYPGGPDAYRQHAKQNYPYGYNQTQLDQARQVMEDAGYGPNNQFTLRMTIYQSQTWLETARLLRDQLASAHIRMEIQQTQFASLLEQVQSGNVDAFSLGWIVPWAAPDAFVKHLNPATSDTSARSPESYTNRPTDTQAAQRAISAWETIQNNTAPTDQAKQARNEAYVTMEESNWTAMANLPVYHEITPRFWYDSVEIPPFGIAGDYKQKFNEVTLG
jgi:ABC-type transport system substrate-binding protein